MDSKMFLSRFNLDSKGFKQLLDTQSLVDCTLACDGGKILAHKIVLSACSSYLAKILNEHPVEHPIIILPELSIEDVKTLVHYMYTGELLKSDTLNSTSLLRTAAILSVNSLNDLLTSSSNNNNNNSHQLQQLQQQQLQQLQQQALAATAITNSQLNLGGLNSLIGPIISPAPPTAATSPNTSTTSINSISSNSNHSNSNSIGNSNKSSEFQFKCPVCHNDFQTICSFEYHMQRTHNVTSFGCEICHKPFASLRYVLTDHMRRCHGWKSEQKLNC